MKKQSSIISSSTHNCDGIKYTYVTPSTWEAGLQHLAERIQSKDFNAVRIALVCEHAEESHKMMQALGKRSVGCLLLNKQSKMLETVLRCWCQGDLHAVLVVCDEMLPLLACCADLNVNYLIHSTQPMPHIFQKRIQTLTRSMARETRVLVIRSEALPMLEQQQQQQTPKQPQTQKLQQLQLQLQLQQQQQQQTQQQPIPAASTKEYTYSNYRVFAWSRIEQFACYNINNVSSMEPSIVTRMQQLNVGKKRAMCVQRYAWPHVAAGRALCVIGNELTGKTWCYLPAACQLVNKEVLRRMDNSSDYGPSCIILCANVGQGEHIADSCTALLDTAAVKVERLVKLFDRSIVQEVALRLRSACGILLTTVELLLQLCQLDTNKAPIFNPLAIRCVAIDNLDIMWRCDRLDVNKAVDWMLKLLRFEQQHTQLIIVGRLYVESLMKRLLPLLPDLLLLFEDELEASIYIGIKQELLITSEQQRDEQLLQLLLCKQQLEQQQPQRVVLTCQTIKNAEMLGQLLASRDIDSYNIMDCKNYEDIKLWSNSERKFVVLIVSDEAVPKLNDMPPIDCLIHYNYAVGWSRFKSRFRLYYGNFRLQRQSSAIIAVCVSDVDPIWYICDFMMKHDQLVPEPWLNLFTNQRTESEHAKPRIAKSLCRQLLAFGNCCRRSCLYRHILWDYETAAPANHPGQGDIRFYVLFCLSPARFAIRRVKYGVSSYFHNMPVTKLGEQIQLHYEQSENRVLLSNPQPGQLCIAKLNQQYQRVCITQEHSDDRVEIKQLDAGVDFLIVNSSDLMVCHDRFVEDEFEANDLRITGLTPLNMERIWPDDAKRLVRNKFFNRPTGKVFRVFTAKVDFCFHETIFVENVYDEAGNDLKSLVLNNLAAHMDESVRPRLLKTAAAAKPYEEAAEGFLEK